MMPLSNEALDELKARLRAGLVDGDCGQGCCEGECPAKAPATNAYIKRQKGAVTADTYERCAEDLLMEARHIVEGKRPAYTNNSDDVLANFRRIAQMTNQTPGQVLAIYMLKHVYAVTTALTNTEVKDPEETIGRFADTINYLLLGWTMLATGIAHERQ
jgi:hypothetical protein